MAARHSSIDRDLPVEMQVKLAALLQEREFRPVGSLTQRKVEIRVIAATHRDLIREVERATFPPGFVLTL